MDFKEPIIFDNVQRCFYVSICLVVACEVYNVIIVVRGFSSPTVCQNKNSLFCTYNIRTRMRFIVRNTGRVDNGFELLLVSVFVTCRSKNRQV